MNTFCQTIYVYHITNEWYLIVSVADTLDFKVSELQQSFLLV